MMTNKELLKQRISEMDEAEVKRLLDFYGKPAQESDPEVEHYYEFTGTWSWGVWAKSKEEAVREFNHAFPEEFDIITDPYKVEEYE